MGVKPVTFGPFLKLVDASTGVLTQPKGSIPRGSNLLAGKRGSLRSCDGSMLVNAYNGVPTAGRGKAMCDFCFAPTGVAAYYLRVMKALDQPLGPPQNLAAVSQSGGSLSQPVTYYYQVTALDGAGGETTVSNEASATTSSSNQKIQLTWNEVPNAVSYNVYRATTPGAEGLLSATGIPVSQPVVGTTTVTFVDDGSGVSGSVTLTVVSISGGSRWIRNTFTDLYNLVLTAPFISSGGTGTYTAGSNHA